MISDGIASKRDLCSGRRDDDGDAGAHVSGSWDMVNDAGSDQLTWKRVHAAALDHLLDLIVH